MKRFIAILMVLCMAFALSSVGVWGAIDTSWQTETPMPTARHSLTSAIVGNKIYAIGGRMIVAG